MSNKTLVPDKLHGYLLQVRHMLYELISVDDRIVSIEALDDVAIESGNEVTAIQVKSVTSSNNPVAERSTVFWKTLYNWCIFVENGHLALDAVFRFVIIANKTIEPGSIQEAFVNSRTDDGARNAFVKARNELLGNTAIDELPDSYRNYVKYIFEASREAIICGIIRSMEIEIHSDSYDNDLVTRFNNQTIPHEYSDILLIYMLGWVTSKVESFTGKNKPAYISAKEYRTELLAQVRAYDINAILKAISKAPTRAEAGGEVARLDTYIRQLNLVQADEAMLIEAASDFLRAKIEKIEWARRGIVTDESFGDYHDALYRMWLNRKRLTEIQFLNAPLDCGKAMYAHCQTDSLRQKLQGVETPSFFGSGSLQGMANTPTDNPRIGWHPNYIDLLKGVKDSDDQL